MPPSPDLKRKLKLCEPEIQNFVAELQLENTKLQKKIAKLEVQNITLNSKIIALRKELKKIKDTPAVPDADISKWFNG